MHGILFDRFIGIILMLSEHINEIIFALPFEGGEFPIVEV